MIYRCPLLGQWPGRRSLSLRRIQSVCTSPQTDYRKRCETMAHVKRCRWLGRPLQPLVKTMSGGVDRRSAARLSVSQRLDAESLVWASSQIATSLRQ